MSRTLVAFAVSAVLAVLFCASLGRPVPVNEPPLKRLGCVSFSHPENVLIFGKRPPVDPADIERELTRISKWTDCIRVYSSDARQETVVPMAQKLGLKVLLGAWINSHPETSHPELERALARVRVAEGDLAEHLASLFEDGEAGDGGGGCCGTGGRDAPGA